MHDVEITPARASAALAAIERLAVHIWHEHYTPIVGRAQVLYMLEKFHTVAAMRQQIEQDDYRFFSICRRDTLVGYFAIQLREQECFLSKFYLERSQRGTGLARHALEFIERTAAAHELPVIRLTVNKRNTLAIAAYQHLGFERRGEAVFDIGEGYIMDDLVFEKCLD